MGGLGGGQDGDLDGAAQEEGVLGARAVELEDAADGRVVAHGERAQRVAALHGVLDGARRGARVAERAVRARLRADRERQPLRLRVAAAQAPARVAPQRLLLAPVSVHRPCAPCTKKGSRRKLSKKKKARKGKKCSHSLSQRTTKRRGHFL